MKRMVWLLIVLGCLGSMSGMAGDYPCPYSGPTDDPALLYDATTYNLDLRIEFPDGETPGRVSGSMTLYAQANQDINHINLDFYKDSDAQITGVQFNNTPVAFTWANHEITVPFGETVVAGRPFMISVDYEVRGLNHFKFLPRNNPRYAYNAMVENSRWFPCLHDPRDKALYNLTITVADTLVVAANGTLESETDNGDGTKTYVWAEHSPMASYLVTVNVADYITFGHTYDDGVSQIPVVYYVVPESLEAAQTDFQHDDDILAFYITRFGEYPFEKMGLAQVKLPGAMENQDMISYGVITGDMSNEDTFAHEMSHMYWGDSVTLTGCEDVWLNEGFASYCEALWEEYFYGEDAYDAVMDTFREKYFSEDATHRYSIYDPEVVWGYTVYKKGAWVLHMLRRVIGETAFWSVLPEYYDRYTYGWATTEDFKNVCEEISGLDLDWFFQEWIYEKGYPEFEVSWRYIPGKQPLLRVRVNQIQENAPDIFYMPATLVWTEENRGQMSETVWLTMRNDVFTFPVEHPVTDVVFDPENTILKTVSYVEPPAETGVDIWMPSHQFGAGDPCCCYVTVSNFEGASLVGYPLFVILDVYGYYYFAPSFTEYDNYLEWYPSFEPGITEVEVLPWFDWPSDTGSGSGIYWYAGLVDPGLTHVVGKMDMWEFGWGS